jgi:hypothetical protein
MMPRIKNITNKDITWHSYTFHPGKEHDVYFFVSPDMGLEVVSELPRVPDDAVISDRVSVEADASITIAMPKSEELVVSIVCESGNMLVRKNYPDAPPMNIGPGASIEIRRPRSKLNCLIITAIEDSIVNYLVEQVI